MRVEIHDIGHGGVGVARHDGRVVFVRGGLPGEVVEVDITARRSKFWNAVVREVVEPSEYRVDHPWPAGAAGRTGAADFGHVSRAGQRALKAAVIEQNIRRIGGEELAEHIGPVGIDNLDDGDGWGTRTRFEVTKLETGVGMYRERTNELLQIEEMPLAVADLAELNLFGTAWDDVIVPGTRMKAVAPASGKNVVVAGGQVYSAPGKKADPQIDERAMTLDHIFDYRVSAAGFWQVHRQAPSALATAVLDAASPRPGETVADLYSGAGLFTMPLARAVGPQGAVYAYEAAPQAVADAQANLAHMPWAHMTTRKIDASIAAELGGVDVVVADPPRSGLGQATAAELGKLPARMIVLVSCDPAAMARDVAQLTASGRKVTSARAIDIFPHTHHVEMVVVMDTVASD